MVIKINKNTNPKDIDEALKKIHYGKHKQSLSDFYGKLKGAFGDAIEYQKKIR
jgi:hypothetical protein